MHSVWNWIFEKGKWKNNGGRWMTFVQLLSVVRPLIRTIWRQCFDCDANPVVQMIISTLDSMSMVLVISLVLVLPQLDSGSFCCWSNLAEGDQSSGHLGHVTGSDITRRRRNYLDLTRLSCQNLFDLSTNIAFKHVHKNGGFINHRHDHCLCHCHCHQHWWQWWQETKVSGMMG